MKAVTVVLLARDGDEAEQINDELQHSQVLNNWPVVSWTTNDATAEQVTWFADEYEPAAS